MVYDPVRQHVLMMGFSGSGIALDTWRWNGVDWQQLVAVAPFTGAASLAFDPAVARPVTVSRIGTTATLHEFNGVTWQPRLSQVVPVNGLLDPFELVVEPGTGRMLEAEEAQRIGLIDQIVPRESFLDEWRAVVRSLAARPVADIKRMIAGGPATQAVAAFARLWAADEHWHAASKVLKRRS